jgi:hypothetical protein
MGANGLDPTLRRTCEKICVGDTLEAVAREFLSVLRAANLPVETPSQAAAHLIRQALRSLRYRRPRSREPISADTVDTMERRLELHVFPYLGGHAVQQLRPGAARGLAAHRVPRHL